MSIKLKAEVVGAEVVGGRQLARLQNRAIVPGELNPDPDITNYNTFNWSLGGPVPGWAYVNDDLVWGPQRVGAWIGLAVSPVQQGRLYRMKFWIEDFDQDGSTSPRLTVVLGYWEEAIYVSLEGKPANFTVAVEGVVDVTDSRGDTPTWFNVGASAVGAGAPSLKITRISLVELVGLPAHPLQRSVSSNSNSYVVTE